MLPPATTLVGTLDPAGTARTVTGRASADGGPVEITWGDQPGASVLEQRVVQALSAGPTTATALGAALGADPAELARALDELVRGRLVGRSSGVAAESFALTPAGMTSAAVQNSVASAIGPNGHLDMAAVGRDVGSLWQAAQEARSAELARSQAGTLADDADRERTVALLEDHYSRGTFDLAELERRTAAALGARTRGELAGLTEDLAAAVPPESGVVRAVRTVSTAAKVARAVILVGFAVLIVVTVVVPLLR
jgi:uncharacterized protein DUF1707